jgi:two-component SAPR family response regulator
LKILLPARYIGKAYAFICILLIFCLSHKSSAQGLLFQANDRLISERTSYKVFDNKIPVFNNHFAISFDLSILDTTSFGYVCFIKDKESNASFSFTLSEKDRYIFLDFNIDSKENLLQIPIKKSDLGYRRWHRIKINFLSDKNSIEIKVDNKVYTSFFKQYGNRFSPIIVFGKHDNVVDVPKIAIRKLVIEGEKKSYSFDFNEHDGNVVHDIEGNKYGKVENPIWLINDSFHWKLRYTYHTQSVAAINFDTRQQQFIVLTKDSIIYYDCKSNTSLAKKYTNTLTVPLKLGMSFLDSTNHSVFVYEVNDLPLNRTTIASLDMNSLIWTDRSNIQLEQQRHHHNGFFQSDKQSYTIFGGFGNRKFSNSFHEYNIAQNIWNLIQYTGDTITPRFFAGQAIENSHNSLLFGGIGNKTGDQGLGKSYYFDCYRINYENHTIKKLWNTSIIDEGLVSVRNMVLTEDKNSFYTICYPEYIPNTFLKLYQFYLKDGRYEILGDSISMNSERIETNANLYSNSITNELYCTTQEFQPDGSSVIKVYSLSEPAVSEAFFINPQFAFTNSQIFYILIAVLVFALIIILVLLRKRYLTKNRRLSDQLINVPDNYLKNQISDIKRTSAIYLFGDFIVIDKKGRDITHLFSPKIKQLFLFIFMNSSEESEGVTSPQIYLNIWPDKPIDKAKNSKGVTLNQLRDILNDIEGIEIVSSKGFVNLRTNELFYCDYFEYQNLLKTLISNETDNESHMKLMKILARGSFLKSINAECFDPCKQKFEDEILTILPPVLETSFKEADFNKVIQMAQILNHIDEQNETVLHYEMVSYINLNKLDLAKKRYNTYLLAFKRENTDGIPISFQDLTNKRNLPLK